MRPAWKMGGRTGARAAAFRVITLGNTMSEAAENLLEKLKSLPPHRLAEVADVVDVLRVREEKTRTRRMDGFAAAQPPLSPEDIQAEIAAARAQQRAANADRR